MWGLLERATGILWDNLAQVLQQLKKISLVGMSNLLNYM